MKKIGNIILTILMAGLIVMPVGAYTCDSGSARVKSGGSADVTSPAECAQPKEDREVGKVIAQVINVVLSVLGIVAVLVIIIGGLMYATSAGDANKASRAKNMILYAVIGLAAAGLAWVIVGFVATGVFSQN